MLCINLSERLDVCRKVVAGVSDLILFDPNDFNFTQATVSGKKGPYTAVAARAGATGQLMFPITFNYEEGELTIKQTLTNNSSSYTHEFVGQLAEIDQSLTTLLESIDQGGVCCGLGGIVRYNNGKIFVFGEKYVNGSSIPRFLMRQNGSDGTSGKVRTDLNGYNLHIVGDYDRPLYEFSGDYATLEAFMATVPTTFDTPLTGFSTNNTNLSVASQGVTATIAAAASGHSNAQVKFEFNGINPHAGVGQNMHLFLSNVEVMSVDFPDTYIGQTFKYTDESGVAHTGTFQNLSHVDLT